MSLFAIIRLLLISFILPIYTIIGITNDKEKPKERPAREGVVIKLFNGKNLDGWYTYLQESGRDHDPKKVFTVDRGMIRVSGEEWGAITTNDEYENYRLVIEYKWGELTYGKRLTRARDGGILIHSKGEDGGYSGIWMRSLECQIIEGGTGDIIVVGDGTPNFSVTSKVKRRDPNNSAYYDQEGNPETFVKGRVNWFGRDPDWKDTIGFRGKNDLEKKLGKWNKLEIVAQGDDFKIFLNGQLVNHATNVYPSRGRIQVQSEAAEMYFRRIDLIPLDGDDKKW